MPLRRVPRSPDLERVARLLGTPAPEEGPGWVPARPRRSRAGGSPPEGSADPGVVDELERLDSDLRRARRPGPITAPEQVRLGRWSVSSGAVVAVLALVLAVVALFVLRVLWAERAVPLDPVRPGSAMTSVAGTVVVTGPTPTGGAGMGTGTVTPAPAVSVVVHVVGQVSRPGLVRLAPGARVADALAAAGGATRRADTAAVNLARRVVDGEQVHVPAPGETVAAPPPSHDAGAGPVATGGEAGGVVDLNTADTAALDGLPGVGPVLAQRILDWRAEHGHFASVDELGEVSGIGDKLMAQLRDRVRV